MNTKWITKILNLMPESLCHQFYRNRAKVPEFAFDSNFTVEIARTEADLESSYRLLHDCYVATKLMKPDPSGLRCNVYTFFPHTTVIVAKFKGETIGTVSLIRDSVWGLPSDQDYLIENNQLRNGGGKLVEVSGLAVAKTFRKSGNAVSLLLMKYLFNYTFQYLKSNLLVCTVHPRAEDFYKALWSFDRNGQVVKYEFVEGALAIHLSMEVSSAKLDKIVASYPSKEIDKNLVLFVLNDDCRFKYPDRGSGVHIDPVLTPELFEIFCFKKSEAWKNLSASEKNSLHSLYTGLFGYCTPLLTVDSSNKTYLDRSYRIPMEISALVQHKGDYQFVKLTDVSIGGAFVAWPKDQADPDSSIILRFKMGDTVVKTKATITWKNKGQAYLQPYGFGIQFSEASGLNSEQLKNWVYNQAS